MGMMPSTAVMCCCSKVRETGVSESRLMGGEAGLVVVFRETVPVTGAEVIVKKRERCTCTKKKSIVSASEH